MTYQAVDPGVETDAETMIAAARELPAIRSGVGRPDVVLRFGQGGYTREYANDGGRLREMEVRHDARVLGPMLLRERTERRSATGWILLALVAAWLCGIYLGFILAHLHEALR